MTDDEKRKLLHAFKDVAERVKELKKLVRPLPNIMASINEIIDKLDAIYMEITRRGYDG
jgi:hypothetical protein